MPKRFSSVVGRSFGDGVRAVIEATGMPQCRIAELLDFEQAEVSDLVNGKGGVTEVELAMFLGLCQAPPDDARHLLALCRETREKAYLQFVESGLEISVRTLVEQERHATKITAWSLILVPGLLQIADYMRAVTAPEAVKVQLHPVLAMAMRPHITVRVVDIAIGAPPGAEGSFSRLSFEKFEPVIFLENARTALYLEDKSSVTHCDEARKGIDQFALDAEHSMELIASLVP